MSRIKRHPGLTRLLLLAGVVALLTAAPYVAASDLTETDAESTAALEDDARVDDDAAGSSSSQAGGGGGASGIAKLAVHGYLTQAWVQADFVDVPNLTLPDGSEIPMGPSPTTFEIGLGIPERGTTDYRFLALQFRYEISPKDVMAIQLSSRELGFSPVQELEDDIELDWAFYERKIGDNASVKVGKVQLPFGIFNEIRDVGTILPFYRPPFAFYREGTFTSETIDGVVYSHDLFADASWGLSLDLFIGEFDSFELSLDGTEAGVVRAIDTTGYQLWLQTPVEGLRFGTGLLRRRTTGGIFIPVGEKSDVLPTFHGSFEFVRERFTIRSEYQETSSGLDTPVGPFDLDFIGLYFQAGVRLTEGLHLWGQIDTWEIKNVADVFVEGKDKSDREDLALSLNYSFSPAVVLKAEHHFVEETGSLFVPVFVPDFKFNPIPFTADDGSYTIISLSVAF